MSDWKARAKKIDDGAGTWKARAVVVDSTPDETTPEQSAGMDAAQAVSIKGLPFPAVARRMDAARAATTGKAAQLFRALGLIDPEPRVSDELHQPPVRINGKMFVEGNRLRDSGPMPDPSFGELYDQKYAQNLALERQAAAEHPGLSAASELTSAVLTPIPKVGQLGEGASIAARMGQGLKQGALAGALFGAGGSDADLSQGEFGRLALHTGVGAGGGGLLGAGGGALSGAGAQFLAALSRRAQRGVSEAVAAETAAQEALASKNIASAKGALGSEVQGGSRDIEVLIREAAALPPGHPVGDAIRAWLNTAEAAAMRESVAASKLASAPERVAAAAEKKAALDALVAGKAANVEAQTAEALKNPVKKHVAPRLLTLAHRLLPPAMGAIGGAVGGAEGAAAGFIGGGIMSLTQGAPGRIVKNLMQKPAARKAFWEGVLKLSGGATKNTPVIVAALEKAAEKGPQEFAATADTLLQSFPETADLLKAMHAQSTPKTTEDRAAVLADILRQSRSE